MASRDQPRSTLAGLRPGDQFKTPFGPVNIEDVSPDRSEYAIHDPQTGERTVLRDEDLLSIMSANIMDYPLEAGR